MRSRAKKRRSAEQKNRAVILPFIAKSEDIGLTWEKLQEMLNRCANIESVENLRQIVRNLRRAAR